MDPNSGRLYATVEDARADGVEHPVEMNGSEASIKIISKAVKAQAKAKRQAQKKARKVNR